MYGCEIIGETQVGHLHAENQDRIVMRSVSCDGQDGFNYVMAVSDGISQCAYGGSVARWVMDQHLAKDILFAEPNGVHGDKFGYYLRSLHAQCPEEFEAFPDMLDSGAALSVACLSGPRADCFWVGDCPILRTVRREGQYETCQISSPDVCLISGQLTDCFGAGAPFELKHSVLDMGPDAILTIISDGARCNAASLNELYEAWGFSEQVMHDVICSSLASKRADDVSFVAAYCHT